MTTGIEHGWVSSDPTDGSEVIAANMNDHEITADVDFDDNKIVNLADPDDPQDAATKAYVDSAGGGGSSGARMFVQQGNTGSWSETTNCGFTWGATPTNGNRLYVVYVTESSANVSSITQTNVSWSRLAESTASTTPHVEIWEGVASGSASTSMAVNCGFGYCVAWGAEFSGLTGTLEDSGVRTAVAVPGGDSTEIITPTSAGALVLAGIVSNGYGAGFAGVWSGQIQQSYPVAGSAGLPAIAWGFPGVQETWMRTYNSNTGGTRSSVIVAIS